MDTLISEIHDKSEQECIVLIDAIVKCKGHSRKMQMTMIQHCSAIIKDEMRETSQHLSALHRNYVQSGHNLKRYLNNKCPMVLYFLEELAERKYNAVTDSRLIIALEHLYGLVAYNFIGPMCFAKHVVINKISSSKRVSDILSSAGPYASYQSVLRFVDTVCQYPLCFPNKEDGDIICAFDNAQRIIKLHKILTSGDFTKLCKVVTANMAFIPDSNSHLQLQSDLSPRNWLKLVPDRMMELLNYKRYKI